MFRKQREAEERERQAERAAFMKQKNARLVNTESNVAMLNLTAFGEDSLWDTPPEGKKCFYFFHI